MPLDETMNSSRPGYVLYKSSLELKAIRYADAHPGVKWWTVEPFYIPYIKPTDNKVHRYFPDLLINQNGNLLLIEVKSSDETKPPKKPKRLTDKTKYHYNEALKTYYINQAKWTEARRFCKRNSMHFCVLTELELR